MEEFGVDGGDIRDSIINGSSDAIFWRRSAPATRGILISDSTMGKLGVERGGNGLVHLWLPYSRRCSPAPERESVAVRDTASSFKSLSGLTNKIKFAYYMLTLHAWQTIHLTLNFSTKYMNHIAGCPTLPPQMKVQICSMDDLPCYSSGVHAAAAASQDDHYSNDIVR
ncbi:hypothetical protein AKJ16_DCAP10049 [Drosera capensis]